MKKQKEKAFNNWKHNAIHLTFPNGNSLSTTWAYGSYSENHGMEDLDDSVDIMAKFHTFRESNTCEVMILQAPDKLVKKIHKKFNGDGSVIGYLTMEEWLEIVKMLSKPTQKKI